MGYPSPADEYSTAARSAWLLISGSILLACVPGIGFTVWLVGAPILMICFVLSIIVLAKGGVSDGIGLVFCTLIAAPLAYTFAPPISSIIFIGALGAAAGPDRAELSHHGKPAAIRAGAAQPDNLRRDDPLPRSVPSGPAADAAKQRAVISYRR